VIDVKRYLSIQSFMITLGAQVRRHTCDFNAQPVAMKIDIGGAGNHRGAAF